MKKIFIIEDDDSHWVKICKILSSGINDYSFCPRSKKQFYKVRSFVRQLQSLNLKVRNNAKEVILQLIHSYNPDLFIMDYALDGMAFNATYVIKELSLIKTVLILTSQQISLEEIDADVKSHKNDIQVKIMKKPQNMNNIGSKQIEAILTELDRLVNPIKTFDEYILPIVVILTAIKEEYHAVRCHLNQIEEFDRNDTIYERGVFICQEEVIAKVIIRECGQKNTNAAQETERVFQYFTPDLILFVGVAGSRKPKDFSIGDVICPNKIYSYEAGKSEKDAFLARPDFGPTSYTINEIVKKVRRNNDWKKLIKNNWDRDVKANEGVIASGEQLIEHYNSAIGDILSNYYNDTDAVEMEGFGFAKAADRQGRNTNSTLIGVVRGISDEILQLSDLNNSINEDRRPDSQKMFASDTASAFAYSMIFNLYKKKDII